MLSGEKKSLDASHELMGFEHSAEHHALLKSRLVQPFHRAILQSSPNYVYTCLMTQQYYSWVYAPESFLHRSMGNQSTDPLQYGLWL